VQVNRLIVGVGDNGNEDGGAHLEMVATRRSCSLGRRREARRRRWPSGWFVPRPLGASALAMSLEGLRERPKSGRATAHTPAGPVVPQRRRTTAFPRTPPRITGLIDTRRWLRERRLLTLTLN
jgi:hypothetical protein